MSKLKVNDAKRHAEICELSYKMWLDAGEPHGDGVNFWLEAEKLWESTAKLPKRSVSKKPVKNKKPIKSKK